MWELDCEESWVPKNWCFWTVVLEKTLESSLDCKEIQPIHPKEISPGCSLEGLILKLKLQYFGTSCDELTHWKWPWCWEGLGGGGEEDNRGYAGWMASPTQWTWVCVNSGSWWWTGRPGMLWFMGSQRVGHEWETELNWTLRNSLNSQHSIGQVARVFESAQSSVGPWSLSFSDFMINPLLGKQTISSWDLGTSRKLSGRCLATHSGTLPQVAIWRLGATSNLND